jgi:hypothetical protein
LDTRMETQLGESQCPVDDASLWNCVWLQSKTDCSKS